MLRTNLATRPFYNDRGVRAGLAVLALVALGLTVFNAIEILRLESAGREARQLVAQNAAQAREMRDKARDIRQSINQAQLAAVQTAAREANVLIDRRAFSWTALLNQFQLTLPPDVRITGVPAGHRQRRPHAGGDHASSRDASTTSASSSMRSNRPAHFTQVLPRTNRRRRGRHLALRAAGLLRRARRLRPPRLGRRLKLGRRRRPMSAPASTAAGEACDEGAVRFQHRRAVVARARRPSTVAAARRRGPGDQHRRVVRGGAADAPFGGDGHRTGQRVGPGAECGDRRLEGCRGDARRPGRCVEGSRSFLWRGAAGELCRGAPLDPAEARADGAGARGALPAAAPRRRRRCAIPRWSGCAWSVRSKATGTTSGS